MGLVIRPAATGDITAIQAVLVETWHATYDPIHGADEVTVISSRWHSIEALTRQLAWPGSVCLVAERDDEVVATSFAFEREPDQVQLSRLYVRPSEQGRGTGHQLLAETLAAFPDAKLVHLEVDPQNHAAIRFYDRHGFAQSGVVKDCCGSSGIQALVYERRLRA